MDITFITEWLQSHQDWLALIIFLIALLESLVVVGLVVPGVVMLFAAASMAGGGALNIWVMLFAGFVGAVIGDGISFLLGQKFHNQVPRWWPFRQNPQWLAAGETFFHKHGGISIAVGRFIGPIRPVIPVVAGMLGMSSRYFYLINIFSALLWAPVYLLPGYLVGASLHWEHALPMELVMVIGVLLLASVALSCLWSWLVNASGSLRFYWLSAVLFAGAFLLMAFSAYCWDSCSSLNLLVKQWMVQQHTLFMDRVMGVWSQLGHKPMRVALGLLGFYWLCREGRWKLGLIFLALTGSVKFLLNTIKQLVAYMRPEEATAYGFSFPSGHTTFGVFLCTWIGWHLGQSLPQRYRFWVWALGLWAGLVTGITRVYMSQHWVGDIIAGTLFGLCALMVWMAIDKASKEPLPLAFQNIKTLCVRTAQLVVVVTVMLSLSN